MPRRGAVGWPGRLWSGPMVNRDGNGWTTCGLGHRHWGRFGAAGLLAYAPGRPDGTGRADLAGRADRPGPADLAGPADGGGQTCVLLQRRSWGGNHGGTWGPPGGARDSHESAVTGAFREAEEERPMPAAAASARGIRPADPGGRADPTAGAAAARAMPPRALGSGTSNAPR